MSNRTHNQRYIIARARSYNAVPFGDYFQSMIDYLKSTRWYKLLQGYTKPCRFDQVDLIKVSMDDFGTLRQTLPLAQYSLEDIYQQLTWSSFAFTFTDEDEDDAMPLVCFRPTRLPSDIIYLPDLTGEEKAVSFQTDMYVSFDGGITTNLTCAIGIGYNAMGEESLFTLPTWIHPNLDSFLNLPENPEELTHLAQIYHTIQIAKRERPEIFVTEQKRVIVIPPAQHKKPRKKSRPSKPQIEKTREVRIIRIDIHRQPRIYTPPTAEQEVTAHSYTLKKQVIHVDEYSYYRNGKKITVAAHDRVVAKDRKVNVRAHKRNVRKGEDREQS